MHTIPSEEDVINPMLDDDDDEVYGATPLRTEEDVINPMLDDDDEEFARTSRKPWEAPVRTPEEEAELQRKKDAGEVSDGRKGRIANPVYRRATVTERDLIILRFLRTFNVTTSVQAAMLFGEVKDKRPVMRSWKAVHNRLLGLREMGLVTPTRALSHRTTWTITATGIDVLDSYHESFLPQRHVTPSRQPKHIELEHNLAVNQVAAQLASKLPYYGKTAALQKISFGQLISEPAIRSAHSTVMGKVKARAKAQRYEQVEEWGDVRAALIGGHYNEALHGRASWDDLRDMPALYALGQPLSQHPSRAVTKGDEGTENYYVPIREHHYPDLVVQPEVDGPQGEATAIEVELSVKDVAEYRSILRTYDFEFAKADDFNPPNRTNPIIFGRVIWFTNSKAVRKRLTEADTFGLLHSGRMLILPLLKDDAKTKVSHGWEL